MGEEEPNVQWTFAVRRTTGRTPGRDLPGRNEDRSPSASEVDSDKQAGVAQLVEQLICNQQVGGSNPSTSSNVFCCRISSLRLTVALRSRKIRGLILGGVPEWPKGADCKSAGSTFGGSNPPPSTKKRDEERGTRGSVPGQRSRNIDFGCCNEVLINSHSLRRQVRVASLLVTRTSLLIDAGVVQW